MIINIDDQISIEILFNPLDREEGYEDDIRFAINEVPHPSGIRLLAADEISILLTPGQAEQIASALQRAASESRNFLS